MPSTVAIAGITRKFSQCIIRAIQESPDVLIRGYCRSPHKLPRAILDSDQIEIIGGSFDDRAHIRRFVRGSDVVICCYFGQPEVMTEGQKYLIDACEEENVPRYIPSDFAVDYTKIPHGVLFPKESAKVIMEYLKSRKVKGAHILTGGLMETFWSEFFGIWNPKMCSMSVWGSGEEVWELTTYQTAAAYTAAVALDKSAIGVFRYIRPFRRLGVLLWDKWRIFSVGLIRKPHREDVIPTPDGGFLDSDSDDSLRVCLEEYTSTWLAMVGKTL
ncbi:hypothetical protein AARAC_000586 [Aspergillus arachidicola]|uniref:NmrA-like domain-containing protein n=1 Tax=Aspergillus arachidicola TaxID=656916 RepID=A0A2G7G7A6_9EURO|nr:hypothetical protein AARAC_000586 [Aspergillus arachidicola]